MSIYSVVGDAELFTENQRVRFAMYCDENGLTLDEGRILAEHLGEELRACADYRATYLPEAFDA